MCNGLHCVKTKSTAREVYTMRYRNLVLILLLISAGSSLPAQAGDPPQENQARQRKIWTNADLEQLRSQGFTPKVPTERVWSNADLNRLLDEGVISRAPAEKVWTNVRLQQHLSELGVSPKSGEKLWTKPDLDRLRDESLISIIGPVEEESVERGQESPPYDETNDSQWYAAKAAALHAELDHRQAELKRFLLGLQRARNNESTTNGVSLSEAIGITPDSAMQFLQQRLRDTQNQLDDLEDLARRNGIEPGILRVFGPPAQ
jgi:hypothetical protein